MKEENTSIELSINRWHVIGKRLEQKIQESINVISRTARFSTPLFGITSASFERWEKNTTLIDNLIVQVINMRHAQSTIRTVVALESAHIAAKMSQETSARKLRSDFSDILQNVSGVRSISDVADMVMNLQNRSDRSENSGVNISVGIISSEAIADLESESGKLVEHSFALQEEIADLNSQKVVVVFDNNEQWNCVNSCLGRG
jgi:hypothetical protein